MIDKPALAGYTVTGKMLMRPYLLSAATISNYVKMVDSITERMQGAIEKYHIEDLLLSVLHEDLDILLSGMDEELE